MSKLTRSTSLCALVGASMLLLVMPGCKKQPKGGAGTAAGTAAVKGTGKGKATTAKGLIGKLNKGLAGLAGKINKGLKGAADALKGKTGTPLPPDQYEKLVLALSSCTLKPTGSIDWKCPAYKTARKARLQGKSGDIGMKLHTHKSAPVRWFAIGLMGSIWAGGTANKNLEALLKLAKTEKDPGVLIKIVKTVASSQGKDPRIGEWLKASLKHEDENVRYNAAYYLAAWGKKTKGAAEALIATLKTDKSVKVKRAACEGAGSLQDEKMLPILRKLALNQKTDPNLYYSCFVGAVKMWTQWIFPPKQPSKKAYLLTVALLNQKPRSDKRPPWGIVSYFKSLHKKEQAGKKQQTWRATAKFYKPKQVMAAIGKVVTDMKAGWMVRTYFVDTLANMGASKAFLQKLRKKYKGKEKDYNAGHVIKKLDTVINKSS